MNTQIQIAILLHYTQSPIKTEDEVLERAKIMDELMDMATGEDDIVMIFANAISDRIEEFENEQLDLPRMKPNEVLANLMHLHQIEPKDLGDRQKKISHFKKNIQSSHTIW